MISVLLLALTSQCDPSGCPAPARFMPSYTPSYAPSYQPFMPAYMPAIQVYEPQQPVAQYDWYRIKHQGLTFRVWGYMENGSVIWDQDLSNNRRAYEAARLAAIAKPAEPPKAELPPINYGVDRSQIQPGEHYTVNSAESRSFVVQAKADAEGKANRIYLTVIGSPVDRKGIADDWKANPWFEPWKEKVWFQEFARGDWQVKDELGYEAKGKPTILVQKPGGEVVLRATSYSGPSPVLAALRKADPSYRPSDDPGPSDQPDDDTVLLGVRPWLALALVIAGAILFIPARRRACSTPA